MQVQMTRAQLRETIAEEMGLHHWPDGNFPAWDRDSSEVKNLLGWMSSDQLIEFSPPPNPSPLEFSIEWVRAVTGQEIEVTDA